MVDMADDKTRGGAIADSEDAGATGDDDVYSAPAMVEYFTHPLIRPDTVEKRLYQETIIAEAVKKNTLVVLPTGTGKTPVAIGLSAIRLSKFPGSKVLVLAPTKPLVNQHESSFKGMMSLDDGVFATVTGKDAPEVRAGLWKDKSFFFSTPQVVENDLVAGRLELTDFSLVVFDEAHRTSGDYAYTYIARKYVDAAKNPLILGLTASPGGTKEKIGIICGNLFIENVEIRTENDWDVKPYIRPVKMNWVYVDLPTDYVRAKKYMELALNSRLDSLKKMGLIESKDVSKRTLLELQGNVARSASETREPHLYTAMSVVAQCIKINHGLELLLSQGPKQALEYAEKLRSDQKTKAVLSILADENFRMAEKILNFIVEENMVHPKLPELRRLLSEKVSGSKKVIVFTQYVTTVDEIVKYVASDEIRPIAFIGQRKGLSQKKQIEILDRFRNDEFNCLVATSVAEEGLDIPKVDLVVFYEPIPSEIRSIQRRGRTGRKSEGDVYILVAKGTIDEAYYWSSRHKEKRMKSVLKTMKAGFGVDGVTVTKKRNDEDLKVKKQESLGRFAKVKDPVVVYTDTRELKILRELREIAGGGPSPGSGCGDGFELVPKQLEVGDFLLSDRLCVERKTFEDFLQSIIDGRLFSQVKALARNFDRPIMILEGTNLYGQRNIHPNAINGALNSIAVDFRIPILWTKSVKETAELIVALARREQDDKKREVQIKGIKKAQTVPEMQEGVVGMLPNVNIVLARRLLSGLGSVKGVVNASIDELMGVEGIGEEKAKKIKEIVEKDYI